MIDVGEDMFQFACPELRWLQLVLERVVGVPLPIREGVVLIAQFFEEAFPWYPAIYHRLHLTAFGQCFFVCCAAVDERWKLGSRVFLPREEAHRCQRRQ